MGMLAAQDVQLAAMRIYRVLAEQRAEWGGRLVLMLGAGCARSGAAAAASVAGGTSLLLDADAAAMKAALRAGYLDFVVNTLDEALRALKNEVRQKRPLSVGLIADVDAMLAEMDERGVAPDLRLGADFAAMARRGEGECFFAAADAAELRKTDEALLAVIDAGDQVRRRWIERAPQFLREARSGGRWVWLNEVELMALAGRGVTPARLP